MAFKSVSKLTLEAQRPSDCDCSTLMFLGSKNDGGEERLRQGEQIFFNPLIRVENVFI